MTFAQTIRHEALRQLYYSKEIAISAAHIRRIIKRDDNLNCTEMEIRDNLYFLTGQGYVERVQDRSTGEVRYRITSAGMLEWESKDHPEA